MQGRPDTLPLSWSQHWEDIRLWRVLRDLAPGYYVDVGAMDPSLDSVTRAFYDRGWRGIDVEPDPEYAEALRRERPGDLVVEAAASDTHGSTTLFRVRLDGARSGLSTVDHDLADRHAGEGLTIDPLEVPLRPLAEVFTGTDAEDPTRFHFLKVDVEGHEATVLRGCGLERIRPLVIVIEAREPNRPTDAYRESEDLLVQAGYRFAADDGLNRWYVREEDAQIAGALAPEINPLLDGNPRRASDVAHERELAERIEELDEELRAAKHERDVAVDGLRREIDAIRNTRSWRITAPLRRMSRIARRPGRPT